MQVHIKVLAVLLATMVLAGCGLARAVEIQEETQAQLAYRPDAQICLPVSLGLSSAALEREVSKRGLGDCSDDHLTCAGYGAKLGSPEYVSCRASLEAGTRNKTSIIVNNPPPTVTTPTYQQTCYYSYVRARQICY
jgi:hypothetical protein